MNKKYRLIQDLSHVLKGGDPVAENELVVDSDEFTYHNNMSLYNSSKLDYMEPSKTRLYTVPEGTILYHGSMNKESFNPYDIRLGDDKLVAYFSPNKRLCADYIVGCAIYPNKNGFIHKFRVKKPIERLLILSTYEKKKQWNLKFLEDSFCSRKYRIQLDGVGFFFPKKDESDFLGVVAEAETKDTPNLDFDSEFAICDPNEYLEYVSTQRCVSLRKLSDDYRFNQ